MLCMLCMYVMYVMYVYYVCYVCYVTSSLRRTGAGRTTIRYDFGDSPAVRFYYNISLVGRNIILPIWP